MAVATVDPHYRAATEAVALLDRSDAGKLALSGSQAAEFLDSVLSNDIAGLSVGQGADAALLTHNGRMLAEVRVLRGEEELLLDTERVALQALFDALTRFRIGYQAETAQAHAAVRAAVADRAGRGEPARLGARHREHEHVAGHARRARRCA